MTQREARGATSQSTKTPPKGEANDASAIAAPTASPSAQSTPVSADGKGASHTARHSVKRAPPNIRNSVWWWIRAAAVLITIVIAVFTIFFAVQLIGVVQSALGAVLTVVLYVLFGAVISFIALQRGLDLDGVAEAVRSFLGAGWRRGDRAWLADQAPATEPRPAAVVGATEAGERAATILAGAGDGDPFPAPPAAGENGETTATVLAGTAGNGPLPAPPATGEIGAPVPPPSVTHQSRRTEVVARPPEGGMIRRRKRSRGRRLWHRVRWPLAAVGVLFAMAAIDVVVRYVPAIQALQHGRTDVAQAQTLLTGDLAHLDQARVARAGSLLADAEQDFGSRSAVLADGWIGGAAAHLPWVGSQVDAALLLRTAAEDGTVAGTNIVGLVEQLVPRGTAAQLPLLQRLVAVAQDRKLALETLTTQLATLRRDVAALPKGHLLGPLDSARTTLRSQGSKVLAAAAPAIALLQALPAAIGPGRHTYLLLLENPGEMRPGGGYIGAVGQVTFSGGAVTGQVFRDSSFSDALVRDLPPPRPFNVYLQHNHPWNLGDAGWSADFPTAVGDVDRFYVEATGVHPDGVIAVDPVALGGILSIAGPIRVPPYPQVITSANAMTQLNYITAKARPGDPGKVFLPPFGQAVVGRLLHASLGEAPAMASSLAASAREKHIVLFFADAQLETLARGAGFDGAVRAPLGDSLEVLDANLSGTSGDLFVSRHFSLKATVGDDGNSHDQLTLSYHNSAPATPADHALVSSSGGDYRDYVQVLVPETTQFDSLATSINGGAPHQVGPEAVTYAFQREDIAYFLIVPRNGTATVTLTYEGPFADISQTPTAYTLNWERQSGAITWPMDVTVTMPRSATKHWSADLSVDRSWTTTASGNRAS